ncbi:MAG: amidohydrolase family protein [Lachnospiraceae bacterium]|nr:amidohydrolase family protein [Lachnospiraceae bacterium]
MADKTIILKGRLIDGNGGTPIENSAVIIEDNKIKTVCRVSECPEIPGAITYESENGSILPGLIDSHVHMSWCGAKAIEWITSTPQMAMAYALKDLAMVRKSGYTSVRDMGSDAIFFKEPAKAGLIDIPKIFGAGKILTQIGGHGDAYQKLSLEASMHAYSPAVIVNGVDEVRRACRVNARNGADFIKIMTTGGVFSLGDTAAPHSHFSGEEIRAAVEEAENMGTYVAAHAQANRGIHMALKNGVKSIEHGFYLDEECVDIMVKNDCYLVPTLSIMHTSKMYFEKKEGELEYLKEKTNAAYEAHYRSLELARKAGVKIAMGCDFLSDPEFGCSYDKSTMEFERMKYAGFTPLEIITMATKRGAELMLASDRLGTVEEGKIADVIYVKGNPAKDILLMCNEQNVGLVLQDGRVVKDIM